MGYQTSTTIVNLITYWILIIPLAYFLCFKAQWGLIGLFAAFPFGSIFQIISMLYLIFKSDWNALSLEATKRIDETKES